MMSKDTHHDDLVTVLRSAKWIRPGAPGQTAKLPSGRFNAAALAKSLGACRVAIAAGVRIDGIDKPGVAHGAFSVFMSMDGWYQNEECQELFAQYVQAGHIDFTVPQADNVFPLLEVALTGVGAGSAEAALAALDCGADERLVPSPCLRLAKPDIKDIYELIRWASIPSKHVMPGQSAGSVLSAANAQALSAAAIACGMKRRVQEVHTDSSINRSASSPLGTDSESLSPNSEFAATESGSVEHITQPLARRRRMGV
jgi:hypothetical protein